MKKRKNILRILIICARGWLHSAHAFNKKQAYVKMLRPRIHAYARFLFMAIDYPRDPLEDYHLCFMQAAFWISI